MKLTRFVPAALAVLALSLLALAALPDTNDATGQKPDLAQELQLAPQVDAAPALLADRDATPENIAPMPTVSTEALSVNAMPRSVNAMPCSVNASHRLQSDDAARFLLSPFALRDIDPVSEASSNARAHRGALPSLPVRGESGRSYGAPPRGRA